MYAGNMAKCEPVNGKTSGDFVWSFKLLTP